MYIMFSLEIECTGGPASGDIELNQMRKSGVMTFEYEGRGVIYSIFPERGYIVELINIARIPHGTYPYPPSS